MEYLSDKTTIGVTSFVMLDSDLQKTNLLGMQLAESFVHEMHKFRIPVIDYKATDYIRVTEEGDFFLSRDFLELKNKALLDYILTGTMVKHRGGYLVNARIIGMKSKAVVATAQSLIPFYVADALLPSSGGRTDGVRLIQGDQ
jgi:TolB-like protein